MLGIQGNATVEGLLSTIGTLDSRPRIWSKYLLTNMHCPSCVSHIEEVLKALHPPPYSVSPSLVTSWVAVEHETSLSVQQIRDALEEAGFDVCDAFPNCLEYTKDPQSPEDTGYVDRAMQRFQGSQKRHDDMENVKHVQHCELCRHAVNDHHDSLQASSDLSKLSSKCAFTDLDEPAIFEGDMEPKLESVKVVDSDGSQDRWMASLAIGGMTCASCVGAVTEKLKEKPWIGSVAVNLITNSATVEFNGADHQADIVAMIEDIGYDATIDSVLNLTTVSAVKDMSIRQVEIVVYGMYCQHCPAKIIAVLERLNDSLTIIKPLSLQDPIIHIKYTPRLPNFTIRDIIAGIAAIDRVFQPAIHHPLSLEERSRNVHAREQQRILIRVLLTLVISIPTVIIGIVFMSLVAARNPVRRYFMHPLSANVSRAQYALLALATPVYFLCADVFHRRALKELRSMWRPGSTTPWLQRFYRFGSMNMLMSLGTSVAYISSVAQLIAAGVHPSQKPDNDSFYSDSVVFLTLFLLVGRLIESYSKSKTGNAVAELGKLRPSEALLIELGKKRTENDDSSASPLESYQTIKVDLLEFGDSVRILHGGSPPCDGVVIRGETKFDESSLTGESKLINKGPGDEVFAGTVNKGTPISIRITGVAGSSMLDQIVNAVREGQTRRAPVERIADTLTGYFVPFVTLAAVLTWVIWLALGYSGALPNGYLGSDTRGWAAWSIEFAISVFVVACPCGLALAAPTALFVGGGIAAQNGILAKGGGEAFEKASRLDCVVFDKTGTLTTGGEPAVTDFHQCFKGGATESGMNETTILAMIHALESNSSHMVARAITAFCKETDVDTLDVSRIEEIPGKGIRGSFGLESNNVLELIIGNESMLSDLPDCNLTDDTTTSILDTWKAAGKSIAIAAIRSTSSLDKRTPKSWNIAALFGISDPVRPEATAIISALHSRGLQVWMLSGDNIITAQSIGREVGISPHNIIADVLPSGKADKIRYLQRTLKACSSPSKEENSHKRALIAMVGDGINDSPALTAADVGIAIGSGSDIAISSAEFVLVTSNLHALLTLLDLSKTVFRRIKFNFAWALMYNLIALPVAAGVLYPLVSNGKHVRLDPVWASLAMALSSISVVCSSLALRTKVPLVGFHQGRCN